MQSYWMQIVDDQIKMELRDIPRPDPGPGQMLVRMRAAALNRGEFILGHGLHKAGSAKALGQEAAGDVVACGPGVTRYKPGDRLMGRCAGAFAEYVLMDEREVLVVPPNLPWEQAAGVTLTFMVTYDMLVLQGRLKAGEWVLINGVTSGVGVTSLLMAKALGAKVIGTSGSQEKLDKLRALGLDGGLCTRKADFAPAVLEATGGKGVNLVVNTVGGSMFAENMRCAAFEGRLATVGYVDDVLKAELDIEALHSKRLTLFGVSNKMRSVAQRSAAIPGFAADILPMIGDGRIKLVVDRVFPFDQLVQAKAFMDSNQHLGKIVLAGV